MDDVPKSGPVSESLAGDQHIPDPSADLQADFSSIMNIIKVPWYRRPVYWLVILGTIFILTFVPWIPLLFTKSITVSRLDAKGHVILVQVGPGTKQWVPIAQVSKHVGHAIVVAEDQKFYQHHGFDFEAISKAIALNKKRGKYARGGSTISQQVVKMAFLTREKTILRKIREATGTVLLELLLSKDQILEWYINLCEFGGGIYGVKSAGMYYFKTRPDLLTIEQAVHLAIVIPSPNKWSKGLRAKSLTPFGQRRFAHIVLGMQQVEYITEVQRQTALARGNFGVPIMGAHINSETDDCKDAKDCDEEDDSEKPSEKPNTPIEAKDVKLTPTEGGKK